MEGGSSADAGERKSSDGKGGKPYALLKTTVEVCSKMGPRPSQVKLNPYFALI